MSIEAFRSKTPSKILVASKDRDYASTLKRSFAPHDLNVTPGSGEEEVSKLLWEGNFSLALVDKNDGSLALFLDPSRNPRRVRFAVLSNDNNPIEAAMYLDQGAEHYSPKSASPDVLGAHVKAILRRTEGEESVRKPVRAGNVEVNLETRRVKKNGEDVYLTNRELKVLFLLAANAGRPLTPEYIYSHVWEGRYDASVVPTVRTFVSRVRRKLEEDSGNPKVLRSILKVGYVLTETPSPFPKRR